MFTQISYMQKELRRLSYRIFNYIENNGNANFEQNGEKIFIENLMASYQKKGGAKSNV